MRTMTVLVSWVAVLCLLSVAARAVAQQELTPFEQSMLEVKRLALAGGTTREKIEEAYLAILGPESTPEERGQVYAAIVEVYASKGDHYPPDVVLAYSQVALTCPLPPVLAARMYGRWAGALRQTHRASEWRGSRSTVVTVRVDQVLLLRLKFLLDKGTPTERVETPTMTLYHLVAAAGSPIAQEIETRQQQAVAAQRRARELNDLVLYRQMTTRSLVADYVRHPVARGELQRLASEALADHPEALQDLLDQLAAAVAENE